MITKLSRKDIKMLESSIKNDVSKSALEEYLSAHKKVETAWKVFRDSLVLSEGSSENNASKEVRSEKVRKFKAGDKVRVLDTRFPVAATFLRVGDITKVVDYKRDQDMGTRFNLHQRPVVVEGGYSNCWSYFEESALELVVEEEKSPNELRAEIIQCAKEFVEEYKYATIKKGRRWYAVHTGFVVNSKERRVIALARGMTVIKLQLEGIAKCNPSDVYNEHIGKAIALGRALGKDVSEFENAVQPTLTKGQVAKFTPRYEGRELEIQIKKVDGEKLWFANRYGVEMYLGSGVSNSNIKIINDTHAQYKGLNNE